MCLHKIFEDDLIFSNKLEDDRVNVTAKFADFDWMDYTVDTRFRTSDLGFVAVKFEYFGLITSVMYVKTKKRYYEYSFDSRIFDKYLKRYFAEFTKSFDSTYAFDPGNIVLDWFNEVIEINDLKTEENIKNVKNIYWEWDIPKEDTYE